MGIEIERKYLLDEEQKIKLLRRFVFKKLGIIQWYIDGGNGFFDSERIRLSVCPERGLMSHKWIYGAKKILNSNLETREEEEYEFDPDSAQSGSRFESIFKNEKSGLKSYPFIMKIRHVSEYFPNAEIVLDSFINTSFMHFTDEYMMEIELKNSSDRTIFEKVLAGLAIGRPRDVTNLKDYTNHTIALKSFEKYGRPDVPVEELIKTVEDRLREQ